MESKNNSVFTALQVQVLSELGIDLWMSRSSRPTVSEASRSHTADPVAETISTLPEIGLPIKESVQNVAFDLVCMRNSHLLLVGQTSGDSDEDLLESLIRVSDTVAKGEKFVFKWPQLDTNSGIDAARKAFLAFTSVQASNLNTPVLLIFGREVASLLSKSLPEPSEGVPQVLTTFDWNGFSCIVVPDVESLRLHWQLKRDLCLELVKLSPAIFSLHPTNALSNPV